MKVETFDKIAYFLLLPPSLVTLFTIGLGLVEMIRALIQFISGYNLGYEGMEYIILVYLALSGIAGVIFIQFDDYKR